MPPCHHTLGNTTKVRTPNCQASSTSLSMCGRLCRRHPGIGLISTSKSCRGGRAQRRARERGAEERVRGSRTPVKYNRVESEGSNLAETRRNHHTGEERALQLGKQRSTWPTFFNSAMYVTLGRVSCCCLVFRFPGARQNQDTNNGRVLGGCRRQRQRLDSPEFGSRLPVDQNDSLILPGSIPTTHPGDGSSKAESDVDTRQRQRHLIRLACLPCPMYAISYTP